MRLFVGIVPSSEAISHAAGAVDRIASTTPDMRWVASERWHLTLAFLGEVDPDRIPQIEDALDDAAASHAPITGLSLAGAGTFRGVLWAGLTGSDAVLCPESVTGWQIPGKERAERVDPLVRLERLARAVQRAVRATGVPVESRPWRPHLTVGRWRPSPRREGAARRSARALADYAGPSFGVGEIRLVHSITGPDPQYRDVHTVTLGAEAG